MATLKINTFTSYTLSREEETSGSIYTNLQRMVLQNHIATIAEQKLGLVFNPQNPLDMGLQDSYLTGQMQMLQTLLQNSTDAEHEIASPSPSASQ